MWEGGVWVWRTSFSHATRPISTFSGTHVSVMPCAYVNAEKSEESDAEADPGEKNELKEYMALPQIEYKTERDATDWWLAHREQFPNLEVMTRQYLGCPASSPTQPV